MTFGGRPAPLLSVQAEQVMCIVPTADPSDPSASYSMQVKTSAGNANSIILPVDSITMELVAVANEDGSANSANHPAAPGSIVTIYGAGFGYTDVYPVDGAITTVTTPLQQLDQFQMQFDDTPATILYACGIAGTGGWSRPDQRARSADRGGYHVAYLDLQSDNYVQAAPAVLP